MFIDARNSSIPRRFYCRCAGAVIGSRYRKAYDTHAPLFWESEPPPAAFAHMPIPRSSKARLSPRISFISKLHIGRPGNFQALSGGLVQFGGFFFRPCGARRSVEGTFQSVAFGLCRCGPGDKSGSPPLLDFSLKVKRNSAHNQSSALSTPRSLRALTRVIDERSVAGSPVGQINAEQIGRVADRMAMSSTRRSFAPPRRCRGPTTRSCGARRNRRSHTC